MESEEGVKRKRLRSRGASLRRSASKEKDATPPAPPAAPPARPKRAVKEEPKKDTPEPSTTPRPPSAASDKSDGRRQPKAEKKSPESNGSNKSAEREKSQEKSEKTEMRASSVSRRVSTRVASQRQAGIVERLLPSRASPVLFPPGVTGPKRSGGASRRTRLFKNSSQQPTKAPARLASVTTRPFVFTEGLKLEVGDIVRVRDASEDVESSGSFFAQVRGLVVDEAGAAAAALTWLLPKTAQPLTHDHVPFRPDNYRFGPLDEVLYPMDVLNFECHVRAPRLRPKPPAVPETPKRTTLLVH